MRYAEPSLTPTARVLLRAAHSGQWHCARALLDSGSETNLITQACAVRCGLQIVPLSGCIIGVGGAPAATLLGSANAHIAQCRPFPDLIVQFRVIHKTTLFSPSSKVPLGNWPHLANLPLSDPEFYVPQPTDIIFSSTICDAVDLREPMLLSQRGSPNAKRTTFGWVLSGPIDRSNPRQVHFHSTVLDNRGCSKEYRDQHSQARRLRRIAQQNQQTCNPTTTDPEPETVPTFQGSSVPRPQRTNGTRRPLCSDPGPCPSRSPLFRPGEGAITQRSATDLHRPELNRLSSASDLPRPLSDPPRSVIDLYRPATDLKFYFGTVQPTSVHLCANAAGNQTRKVPDPEYARLLENLFALESVPEPSPLSPDELKAEEIFSKSCSRSENGRFSVALPFRKDPGVLGNSRMIAMSRLFALETRHKKHPHLRPPYESFMREYLEAGHMELAPPLRSDQVHYYIPHHAVHRPEDPPEKIRVVFNASQKSSSGVSLNELLLPGPRLQLDIWRVVLSFRFDRFVFTADIRQMFRQIQHPPEDRDLLRILWRFDPNGPVQDYQLTTVTYGTTSAPFLACRVLQEIALSYASTHPKAAEILSHRTYVDDVNGGGPTVHQAVQVRNQLIDLLDQAQIELRKWAANDPALLQGISSDHVLPAMSSIDFEEDETGMKVLGLRWDPSRDVFHFRIRPLVKVTTKRELASQIAKIFDPLGWLMPVTVFARVIFRAICQNSYDWDDQLPSSLQREWSQLAAQLPGLSRLSIPRFLDPHAVEVSLVGFSDASERAYAAAVYVVYHHPDRTQVRLLMAKARIAPMKAISLPRLELCAAHLLSKTLYLLAPTIPNLCPTRTFAFSDSTIALSWITADPAPIWKVFVGNRVADITDKVPSSRWFHVQSSSNPADCASRGITPEEIHQHPLWWEGPSWLKSPLSCWPLTKVRPDLSEPHLSAEIRSHLFTTNVVCESNLRDQLEDRFSSLAKLQTVVAWCCRFGHNARSIRRRSGPLTCSELELALRVLIRRAQSQDLSAEIRDAQLPRPRLKLTRTLGLFLDPDGILRVGGRLRNADLPDQAKHPALLPPSHPLTVLIVRQAHSYNLHVGPAATLAYLRTKFWIVNGRDVVRRLLAKCNKCFSVRPQPFSPPMGQLPADRTSITPAFTTTGVDYAGPFCVRIAGVRSSKVTDAYLAVFVCFSTKAVHLEVVSELSTAAFLAAYNRFVARRGHPSTVWSDNGRNFLGASNELRKLADLMSTENFRVAIGRHTVQNRTEWKFIPPHAPHFGGLWEAAVKSAKRLLKIIIGAQTPTLEIFITIITQVEAVLNSRPLTAMSSSPDDLQVLTPGHFLIFRPITAPPSDQTLTERTALRSKWAMAQFMVNQFWRRWTKEYLLQEQRSLKWNTPDMPAQPGQIVLIMEDNLPPLQWSIGRITKIYPGPDGIARVADLRTPTGAYQRPVRRLCPLPEQ